jgi:hypothetical protein
VRLVEPRGEVAVDPHSAAVAFGSFAVEVLAPPDAVRIVGMPPDAGAPAPGDAGAGLADDADGGGGAPDNKLTVQVETALCQNPRVYATSLTTA